MRTTLYPLVDALNEALDLPGPVVEFGALRVDEQSHLPSLRSRFEAKGYVGTDARQGPGVDAIEDLHKLSFDDESVGTELLLDTIEHVREPWTACTELHRCLKPGGFLVVATVFFFPIHAHPDDYWRFTASGLESLLSSFDLVAATNAGTALLPHSAVAVAAKEPVAPEAWRRATDALVRWAEHDSTSWKERALVTLPPSLLVRGYSGFQAASRRRGRAGRSSS